MTGGETTGRTRKLSDVNTGRDTRLGVTNFRRRWASESSKWTAHRIQLDGGGSLAPFPWGKAAPQ